MRNQLNELDFVKPSTPDLVFGQPAVMLSVSGSRLSQGDAEPTVRVYLSGVDLM